MRDGTGASNEHWIMLKEAVRDEALAAAEVDRLTLLNADKAARSFYQATRLFSSGVSAASTPPEGKGPPSRPAA